MRGDNNIYIIQKCPWDTKKGDCASALAELEILQRGGTEAGLGRTPRTFLDFPGRGPRRGRGMGVVVGRSLASLEITGCPEDRVPLWQEPRGGETAECPRSWGRSVRSKAHYEVVSLR